MSAFKTVMPKTHLSHPTDLALFIHFRYSYFVTLQYFSLLYILYDLFMPGLKGEYILIAYVNCCAKLLCKLLQYNVIQCNSAMLVAGLVFIVLAL